MGYQAQGAHPSRGRVVLVALLAICAVAASAAYAAGSGHRVPLRAVVTQRALLLARDHAANPGLSVAVRPQAEHHSLPGTFPPHLRPPATSS